MSDETREFGLGAVLTVTTGILLCDIGEVYELLGFMVDEALMTHQLPRVGRECQQPLLDQFPALREVVVPEGMHDEETVKAWLDEQAKVYGATFGVARLAPEQHTHIGPLTELRMMRPDAGIIVVEVDGAS